MLRSAIVLSAMAVALAMPGSPEAMTSPQAAPAQQPQPAKPAHPPHAHSHGDEADNPLAAATRVSAADAKKAVDAGKAVILDVRSAQAYQANHIAGSINIPLNELATRAKELPRDKQIIAYCT